MKLYSRQLNSLEELKREKQALKAQIAHAESEGFFSLSDIMPGKKDGDSGDVLSQLGGILGGNDTKDLLGAIAGPALGLIGDKIEKQTLKKIAKEVLGSYVKWKSIELAYAGVRMLLDKYKHKSTEK